ncbi:MAG: hypothetical protein NTZ25_01985 [Candidatus Peregrinibacteria bacterium]|nr:hypothetical protein [Candidatus Peregrinibacteria bacterium]
MGINKFVATTLSVLAIGGAAEGCSTEPVVEQGITLTDPTLDKMLRCTREQFQETAFHSAFNSHLWADKNCPGFNAQTEGLLKMDNPLSELVKTREAIFRQAGVAPDAEQWIAPFTNDESFSMRVDINSSAVDEARKLKRVK